MSRIAAIDFGLKRLGIAITDERKILATPLYTFEMASSFKATAVAIKAKLSSYLPLESIVIGLPLLMNGKEGDMCELVRKFGKELEEIFSVPIIYWDERLTSSQVERSLRDEMGMKRKERTKILDKASAALILQSLLDSKNLAHL